MTADPLFCLFQCNSRAYAVAVELVAGIVEMPTLVRVGLCPPVVLGVCPFRRDVVPVVEFATGTDSPQCGGYEQNCHLVSHEQSVLIVQAARGAWGIRVDRSRTRIAMERPSRHEVKTAEDGTVVGGIIRSGATEYALLDVDATWQALRSAVLDRYVRCGAAAAPVEISDPGLQRGPLRSPLSGNESRN